MDLEKTIKELSTNEKKVLLTLKDLKGEAKPEDIQKKGDFNQEVEVMNAASWLQSKQLLKIRDHIKTVYLLKKEGKEFLKKGLPERRALKIILDKNGKASIKDLSSNLKKNEIPVAIGWLKKRNWADIKKEGKDTFLSITNQGKKAFDKKNHDEEILEKISKKKEIEIDKKEIKPLLSRKDVIREKEIVSSSFILTEKGKKVIGKGIEVKDQINQITSSVIKDELWKKKSIRPYDIFAFAPKKYGGKIHPLTNLINSIKKIFFEMGFEEIKGNYIESSFWNMDVLFIPQDHPAREMQDTLYLEEPSKIELKDKKLVDKIKKVHENGGNTGSTGWGYSFSTSECKKPLLRTHTTVNTIRYLYNNPNPPCKVFSIGRVFRKENIDSTHLPEFYQIEGIIHEENANFKQLIGILKEFYKRMGFEKVRCRPGYFPYTEPSMEIDVYWNNQWMELGGSGIFRPEVTEPVGVKNPVLAWGLGLERLAMLKFGLKDMRDLYISDIEWIRKTSLF